jgi:hypothetical protein
VTSPSAWDDFPIDPRSPEYRELRASDADREVVQRVLGDAYADGRLTREEFDQRSDAVLRARTLSDLPVLITDLIPSQLPAVPHPERVADTAALETRAVAAYQSDRREAAWAFVSASMVCWVIWWVTSGPGGFPWPVFVMLGTGLNLLRLLVMRSSEIDSRRERLERKAERKQLKETQKKHRGELERGGDDGS